MKPSRNSNSKLYQSEQRLRDIADVASDWFWETDSDLRFTYISDRFYEVTFVSPNEVIGKTRLEFVSDDERKANPKKWEDHEDNLLNRRAFRNLEYQIQSPDGKPCYIQISGKPYYDQDGVFLGYRGVGSDITVQKAAEKVLKDAKADLENQVNKRTKKLREEITDRKRAKEELRENIHFLENLEKINQAIISSKDPYQMLNNVVESVFELFGCDRAWLLYPCDPNASFFKVPIESTRPEYPGGKELNLSIPMTPSIQADMMDALTAEGPVTYGPGNEKPISTDTSTEFSVLSQMYMSLNPRTGNAWMFGMHQCSYSRVWTDNERRFFNEIGRRITDGLSSLLFFDELTKSEEKYRNVLENIDDGYYEVDIAGNYIFFNDSMCKILGYSSDELMGMNNREYMDEENAKKIFKTFNKVYRTGMSTKALDWKLIKKDGSDCFVETVVSLMKDPNGNGIGFRGIARDITERKQLESQLQQAMKMESIGTLAGGIAHDFNNLLMGIQGRTSLVLADKNSSHPDFEHLKGIEDYVISAADLTKQLLGFARGGKYEVKPTDIKEMIKKSTRMFGRTKKEIEIHIKHQKELGAVEADQGQLEQVLMNLYVNAWQAMPDGGDLYIQTKNVNLDENYVKPFKVIPGRYAKISVTDTGSGMDEATRLKIFEPFFTTKEMGRGTGLGLAFVYGILKNHGGFINVYSEKGEGTTFNIYLPLTDREAQQEHLTDDSLIKGSGTILLVDDEEMIREVGQAMLEKLGYRTIVAVGGEQAVDVIKRKGNEIDLVILDLIMPGMDGGQTFDRIMEIRPELPVILSSGYAINGKANDIMQRGCSGFIQKPFNLSGLSQKVQKILNMADLL